MKETVLLVFSPSSANSNALIGGVSAYAHQRKWRIHMIDKVDRKSLTDAIEFFHPVGCLIGGHINRTCDLVELPPTPRQHDPVPAAYLGRTRRVATAVNGSSGQ